MNQGIVATRYAKGLLAYAKDAGAEDRVYEEAAALVKSFIDERMVLRALANPLVRGDRKIALIAAAAGGKLSDELRNFAALVIRRNREEYMGSMFVAYIDLYNADKNLIDMTLTSAVGLSDGQAEKVRLKAEELTGSNVRLKASEDKGLIGGFVLRWDTYRLDASIAGSLKRIGKELGVKSGTV